MAKKTKKPKKIGTSRQALARRKTLEYVRRLGLRKAANRLDSTVKDLKRWLDKGFPSRSIPAAVALGSPGGKFVYVKSTNLAKLLKKRGPRSLATLTGVPSAELKAILKKRPQSRVKFDRRQLAKLVAKKGASEVADLLGTRPGHVRSARNIPLTQATKRLKALAKHYGNAKVATFLGIGQQQLKTWLKRSIPPTWEADVSRLIGKKSDQGTTEEKIQRRRTPSSIEKGVASAVAKTKSWNKKAPHRFKINLKNAERWAKLGTFKQKFDAAQAAYQKTRKPQRASKPKKPPKPAPRRQIAPPGTRPEPPPPIPGEKPPEPPRPPKTPPTPSVSKIPKDAKNNFIQARAEAFAEGKDPRPEVAWGRTIHWRLINRRGVHAFHKVERFVHELSLDELGEKITNQAKQMWGMVIGDGRAFMSVRFMFSVLGDGNPFYPDAFVQGNNINFITRNIKIDFEWQIEQYVQEAMSEIYMIDSEVTMLFLEYYEIIKSIPIK